MTSVEEAQAGELQLAATKSLRVGIDIETTARAKFAERRPSIPINTDGSVRDRGAKRDKARKPPELDPHRADIATLQLYSGGPAAFVFRGDALRYILASAWLRAQKLVAHNALFELSFLHEHGLAIWCTLQAGGLIVGTGFGGEGRSLANVARTILGVEPPKVLGTSDWGAPQLSIGQIAYAASDAVLAYLLWPRLRAEFFARSRDGAFKLQQGAIPATVAMQRSGILLDRAEHGRQVKSWSHRLVNARREFLDITGCEPPITDNEIRDWLVRTVSDEVLASWPRTAKTGALSTKGKHLKRLLDIGGVEQLLTMLSMQQLLSNFGPNLAGFISPATGRIHASYHLAATKAGRFSASKPNLQQLPGETTAPDFRRCIVAERGRVFVGGDWNQVEMRAAAWLSRDWALTAVYASDPVRDLHCETAAAITGTPYGDVTPSQRHSAKPVNFGAIYGIGALTLSEDAFDSYGIVMSVEEAQRALDRFFATYYGFNEWRWENWNQVKATQ